MRSVIASPLWHVWQARYVLPGHARSIFGVWRRLILLSALNHYSSLIKLKVSSDFHSRLSLNCPRVADVIEFYSNQRTNVKSERVHGFSKPECLNVFTRMSA